MCGTKCLQYHDNGMILLEAESPECGLPCLVRVRFVYLVYQGLGF